MLPETFACEAVNHWINTGIEHGQYDSDLMCDCVLTEDPSLPHPHAYSFQKGNKKK